MCSLTATLWRTMTSTLTATLWRTMTSTVLWTRTSPALCVANLPSQNRILGDPMADGELDHQRNVWCWWWLFFFLACEDFFWMFDQFISSLRFLKFKLFFFYLVEIISSTLIPLFRPGSVQSCSASWHDCGWVFFDELLANSFSDRLYMPGQRHSQPTPTLLGQWRLRV